MFGLVCGNKIISSFSVSMQFAGLVELLAFPVHKAVLCGVRCLAVALVPGSRYSAGPWPSQAISGSNSIGIQQYHDLPLGQSGGYFCSSAISNAWYMFNKGVVNPCGPIFLNRMLPVRLSLCFGYNSNIQMENNHRRMLGNRSPSLGGFLTVPGSVARLLRPTSSILALYIRISKQPGGWGRKILEQERGALFGGGTSGSECDAAARGCPGAGWAGVLSLAGASVMVMRPPWASATRRAGRSGRGRSLGVRRGAEVGLGCGLCRRGRRALGRARVRIRGMPGPWSYRTVMSRKSALAGGRDDGRGAVLAGVFDEVGGRLRRFPSAKTVSGESLVLRMASQEARGLGMAAGAVGTCSSRGRRASSAGWVGRPVA